MRLFVTGASGFVGSHFVEHALAAGHEVVGLCRPQCPESRRATLTRLTNQGARLINGDVLDPASLDSALDGADCVVHFAAAFREAALDDEYFRRVNVEATARLLEAAHKKGVRRFVLCSTAGIYGRVEPGVIDESKPVRPWNAYERSKVEAEEEVRQRAKALGMEYVILRPVAVYGPRDERLLKLFRSAAKGRFPLFGRGDGRRHMVYVSDLAEAFLRACEQPGAANQEVIVAGPEAVPLRDMLGTLARLTDRQRCGPRLPLKPMLGLAAVTEDVCNYLKISPPLYRRRMDFYTNDAAFDTSRAKKVLGWEPKVSLKEGLSRTLQSYKQASQTTHATAIGGVVWLAEILAFVSENLSQASWLLA